MGVQEWIPAILGIGTVMRKLLLAGTAVAVVMAAGSAGAADLSRPVYKAPPPPIPVFSWTGLYVGVHVGGAWGTKEWSDPVVFDGFTTFTFNDTTLNNYGVNGFLGGLQIGYNYQSGPWVWGVEAQASWAGIRGSDACFFFGKGTCKTNVDALGSFAVRFGGTIDRAMLYVKGGLAWAYERHALSTFFFGGKGSGDIATVTSESKHWRWGGMLGAGVEFAFTNSISGKLEYNYMDFGTRTYTFGPISNPFGPPGSSETLDVKIRQNIHLVKVGLNFRWDVGKAPVVARY
jgi:outer membrane immunogenic protein